MANRTRTFHFLDPQGDEIVVTNLKEFCKAQDLDYDRMYKMGCDTSGAAWYEGYTVSENNDFTVKHKNMANITLVNEGLNRATSHTYDRQTLAKESGISVQSIWRLMSGKAVTVRGWRVSETAWVPATPDDNYDPAEEDL